MRKLFYVFMGLVLGLVVMASLAQAQAHCARCGGYHLQQMYYQQQSPGVIQQWGSGQKLQVAIASAQYRAARGIRGHSYIDRGRRSGVGWSTSNRAPRTCYWGQRHRGAYASVRGRDGYYYGTLIL